jgi:hypothetical protein
MDWVAFILQIFGAVYLFKKRPVAWVYFIISNLLWIVYFLMFHPDMISAIVQTVLFLALDFFGLWCWKRDAKQSDTTLQ